MAELRMLSGGTVYQWDRNRIQFRPNADPPHYNVSGEGRITANSGAYLQLERVQEERGGNPDPNWVEVAIRQSQGATYILLIPTTADNPRARPLRAGYTSSSRSIYNLKQFFAEAGIELKKYVTYRVLTEIVNDETFGPCVAGNWTAAKAKVRRRKAKPAPAMAGGTPSHEG